MLSFFEGVAFLTKKINGNQRKLLQNIDNHYVSLVFPSFVLFFTAFLPKENKWNTLNNKHNLEHPYFPGLVLVSCLYICIAYICCISVLHIFMCIYVSHIFIAYLYCTYAYLYCFSPLHICIANMYCISWLDICIAHRYCIYVLHIFVAHLYCISLLRNATNEETHCVLH